MCENRTTSAPESASIGAIIARNLDRLLSEQEIDLSVVAMNTRIREIDSAAYWASADHINVNELAAIAQALGVRVSALVKEEA